MKAIHFTFIGILLVILGIWFGQGMNKGSVSEDKQYSSAKIYEIPVTLPQFTLTDHNGKGFTRWSLSRKWTFMFFGYTFCPDVCPMGLVDLNAVYNNLVDKGDLIEEKFRVNTQVVFVSVDPERDTIEGMKEYIAHFNDDFIAVTGKTEEISSLAHPMGVAYMRVPGNDPDGVYYIDHSASFMLLDPLGRLRASFPPPHDPAKIAEDFRKIRAKYTEECCITSIKFKPVPFSGFDDEDEDDDEDDDEK